MNFNDPEVIKAGLVLIGLVIGCVFGPKIMAALGLNKTAKSKTASTVADEPVPMKGQSIDVMPVSGSSAVDCAIRIFNDPKTDKATKLENIGKLLDADAVLRGL